MILSLIDRLFHLSIGPSACVQIHNIVKYLQYVRCMSEETG